MKEGLKMQVKGQADRFYGESKNRITNYSVRLWGSYSERVSVVVSSTFGSEGLVSQAQKN